MNWITNYVRPRINSMFGKREMPDNLWIKCPETGEMVFHKELEDNLWVIPASGFHMKMPVMERLKSFFDDGEFEQLPEPEVPTDPLKFRDMKRYSDRMRENRTKTGHDDSIVAAVGQVHGLRTMVIAHDFAFLGGSLGMAAGEAIVGAMERALKEKCPVVLFAASGGARMQEGILSLMQMPRTTLAVNMLRDANLPYIVVLTNPTTGGVTASYAMLGDIHIAEPGAVIGFAGKRVIEQTIREQLPDDFQTAEYLRDHGMVDLVVPRHEMKDRIGQILSILMHKPIEAPKAKQPSEKAEIPVLVSSEAAPA